MTLRRSLYFAYGSNMDIAQMQERCPDAQVGESAVLNGYRFLINSRGVASVAAAEGAKVHGLLWSVTDADLRKLDGREGVSAGMYARSTVDVLAQDQRRSAWVYIAADNISGTPRPNYLEGIVAAARAAQLPDAYIEELEGAAQRTSS